MNRLGAVMSLVFAALLTAALAALWLAPGPQERWRQWQAPPPQAPQLDDVQAANLRANPAARANYPAVLERPLFSPARRPQVSASAAVAAPPAPSAIEQIRLRGLVAGPTLTGVMLHEDGKSRFVRVGESVGGWTLERVQARAAVFARAGQQREIALEVTAGAADSSKPPQPIGVVSKAAAAQGGAPTQGAASPPAVPSSQVTSSAPAGADSSSQPSPAAQTGSRTSGSVDRPATPRMGTFGGSKPARPVTPAR